MTELTISCRHCDNHCVLGTHGTGSEIIGLLIPSGWVPRAENKVSGVEIHFICPECEHPKLNRKVGRPTHPPPPRKKS